MCLSPTGRSDIGTTKLNASAEEQEAHARVRQSDLQSKHSKHGEENF